ncbi:MAG TPA: hypothetical protein VE734_00835 [Terriglobales bacterium]|nr:hypothetical protein [Terriglobales bacterium]
MKTTRLPVVLLMAGSLLAQSNPAASSPASKRRNAAAASSQPAGVLADEVKELRDRLDAQQQRIQALTQQLQSRDSAIEHLQQQMATFQATATQAAANADPPPAAELNALKSDVSDLKMNATNIALSVQEEQKRVNEMVESPLALHYKGVSITPGGFLAAESVWRQHATASDVNTPFNSIPFAGADASHLTEWFGSGRQSRVSLLAEGKIKSAKLSGYWEMDWLSAGLTSNNNQSNSYANRQRQLWGQAALNSGWTFTGGQMWSLVTETKKGLDPRSEALPMTIDAQYQVGFSWARQFGFRVTKNFHDKVWLGFSVENAQTLNLGGGGFPANFVVGSGGTGGGLYNSGANYSFNYTPDFIVKAAFEPGFGHYEVFGIISNFRDRVYPNATATPASSVGAFNDARTGGGVGANARWSGLQKHLDVGIHFLGGDGVGRYGTSTLPDVTAHPDGTLAMIHSYQALGTLEWHSKHWDIYSNAGGEYAARTIYLNATGAQVGFGRTTGANTNCLVEPVPTVPTTGGTGFSPATSGCPDTRNLIEGTFGFWYKPYAGPKGRIQFGPQYSYLVKNTWANTTGNPHAIENMVFTSFRYYLP